MKINQLAIVMLCLVVTVNQGVGLAGTGGRELIPLERFFERASGAVYTLSPDGETLAFLAPWNDVMNVYVQPAMGGEAVRLTDASLKNILGIRFATSDTLLFLQDEHGDENYQIHAVDLQTGIARNLTPYQGVQSRIVDLLPGDEDTILISMNRRNRRCFDLYSLDMGTGACRLVAQNPGNITQWLIGVDGRVVGHMSMDGQDHILSYASPEGEMKTVLTVSFPDVFKPLKVNEQGVMYVLSNIGRDKIAAWTFDPGKGEFLECIASDPVVDVDRLLFHPGETAPIGMSMTTEKTEQLFFDNEMAELQSLIAKHFPEGTISILSQSSDASRCLVVAQNSYGLRTTLVYDAPTDTVATIATSFDGLADEKLAVMKPIEFTARDGQVLRGYLTLPADSSGEPVPLVVLPHGGPSSRDTWGFSPIVQFLANRGAAVLQVNFRGSTGFGRSFLEAGFREWGGLMQDDITDGVAWCIANGLVDPDRVAIMGSSYGGYAALAGIAFTPDMYACAISICGPSNLLTLIDGIPPYWESMRRLIELQIGDPNQDREALVAASPLFHAENITAPLLIAQGGNDPRVPRQESERMAEAIEANGGEVELMLFEDEGHGISKSDNRIAFYRRVESFLAAHIGTAMEDQQTIH